MLGDMLLMLTQHLLVRRILQAGPRRSTATKRAPSSRIRRGPRCEGQGARARTRREHLGLRVSWVGGRGDSDSWGVSRSRQKLWR